MGVPLAEVPDRYLLWVLDNLDNLSPTLRTAIRVRLGLEEPAAASPPPENPFERFFARKEQEREELGQKVKEWYRQLTNDYHPDRRGSHDAMVALTDAHDRLRKLLGV